MLFVSSIQSIKNYQTGKYVFADVEGFPGTVDSAPYEGSWTVDLNKRHWYLAQAGDTCTQTCTSLGLQFTAKSRSKLTQVAPWNMEGALAAFREGGASCSKIHDWRDYLDKGSPFANRAGDICIGFGNNDGSTSTKQLTGEQNVPNHHRPLCYCQEPLWTYPYEVATTQGWLRSLTSGAALEAMKSCDKSIALLTGPFTSVGTLQDIVRKLIEKKSKGVGLPKLADYLPGECCVRSLVNTMCDVFSCDCYCSRGLISVSQHVSTQLDTALTSEYPGHNVRVSDNSL